MGLFNRPENRPDPAGWRLKQHSGKGLPHEVVWPENVCHRCKVVGQMYFSSGKAQCAECESRTIVQVQPGVGLHERREIMQLEA